MERSLAVPSWYCMRSWETDRLERNLLSRHSALSLGPESEKSFDKHRRSLVGMTDSCTLSTKRFQIHQERPRRVPGSPAQQTVPYKSQEAGSGLSFRAPHTRRSLVMRFKVVETPRIIIKSLSFTLVSSQALVPPTELCVVLRVVSPVSCQTGTLAAVSTQAIAGRKKLAGMTSFR